MASLSQLAKLTHTQQEQLARSQRGQLKAFKGFLM